MIQWKQSENKWSMLEIICHLYDEEREDFRSRLAKILFEDQLFFVKFFYKNRHLCGNRLFICNAECPQHLLLCDKADYTFCEYFYQ